MRSHSFTRRRHLWAVMLGSIAAIAAAKPAHADPWTWTTLPVAPVKRAGHSAVYDPVGRRMIVFGGYQMSGFVPIYSNDVWEVSDDEFPEWRLLATAGTPPEPRSDHSAVYDPVANRVLVFAGGTISGSLDDLWELSLARTPTWRRLAPAGTPPSARSGHSAIYDPLRRRMLVFGGSQRSTTPSSELWELVLEGAPTWRRLSPEGAIRGRLGHVAVYDPVGDRMLVFAGRVSSRIEENDTWALSLNEPYAWWLLVPGESPTDSIGIPWPRTESSGVFDSVWNGLVIMGGIVTQTIGSNAYDAWILDLSGVPSWSRIPGQARGLAECSAVLDPVSRRVVTFGGLAIGFDGSHATAIHNALSLPEARDLVALWLAKSEASAATVRVQWHTTGAIVANLLRRTRDTDWAPLATLAPDAEGIVTLEDHDVVAGTRYGYRIVVLGRHGEMAVDDLWIDVPPRAAQIHSIAPNPTASEVVVVLSLPDASPAALEIFDITGRRVTREALSLGPGEHRVRLERTGELWPGIYWARLVHPLGAHVRRLAIAR